MRGHSEGNIQDKVRVDISYSGDTHLLTLDPLHPIPPPLSSSRRGQPRQKREIIKKGEKREN